MGRGIKKFYKKRGTSISHIVRIGRQKGYNKYSIIKAAELVYYERDKWPEMALVAQIFCKARNLSPKFIKWEHRKWWKRVLQSIFFPRTLIWEYDKWDI